MLMDARIEAKESVSYGPAQFPRLQRHLLTGRGRVPDAAAATAVRIAGMDGGKLAASCIPFITKNMCWGILSIILSGNILFLQPGLSNHAIVFGIPNDWCWDPWLGP